jgi:hypothetical protein
MKVGGGVGSSICSVGDEVGREVGEVVGDSVTRHEFDSETATTNPSRQGQVTAPSTAAQYVVVKSQSLDSWLQGCLVGWCVGEAVGVAVVGEAVGAAVGFAVGATEGAAVAVHDRGSPCVLAKPSKHTQVAV